MTPSTFASHMEIFFWEYVAFAEMYITFETPINIGPLPLTRFRLEAKQDGGFPVL